ncbi:MAG: Gfo/Idh/MocA family protein [Candidatus Limnocylindrales bacterium]
MSETNRPSRLRAAVVGMGFIGPHHVDAIRRAGYADVVAVVGSDLARIRASAAVLGVPRATVDLDEVLGDRAIDVIHVCTPNRTHVEIATAVLAAGKHLVLEKPVATDRAGATALLAAAARSSRHAMVALTYRGYPMVRRARAIVAAGSLGELRLVHGGYLQDWLARPADYNWRVDPGIGGPSRAVGDIGTHWFDAAEFVSGVRVEAVLADLATFIPTRERSVGGSVSFASGGGVRERIPVTSEDAATILLRFAGGARGTVLVSQVSPGRKNAFTLDLAGSERSLAWAQEEPEELRIAGFDRTEVLRRDPSAVATDPAAPAGPGTPATPGTPALPAGHPEGWGDALRDLFRPFYAAVAANEPPPRAGDAPYPTLRDGARGIEFVEAVLQSATEGRWQALVPIG